MHPRLQSFLSSKLIYNICVYHYIFSSSSFVRKRNSKISINNQLSIDIRFSLNLYLNHKLSSQISKIYSPLTSKWYLGWNSLKSWVPYNYMAYYENKSLSIHWLEGNSPWSISTPFFFYLANNSPSSLELKSTLQFIITNHLPI